MIEDRDLGREAAVEAPRFSGPRKDTGVSRAHRYLFQQPPKRFVPLDIYNWQ